MKPNTAKAGVCNQAILNSLNKAQKQDKFLLQALTNKYLSIKPAEGKKPTNQTTQQKKPKPTKTPQNPTLKPIQKYCILSSLFIIFT